ncbi:MAG: leucine-rich repeat protein [Muribaculaceae bacterium]|nr:leucine-rich repeat protein [Muribaculaceae bacterium]
MALVLWTGIAAAQNTKAKSGKCSSDVEWEFDGRTLYIKSTAIHKGTVPMPDYDLNKDLAPWIKQQLSIRKVVIGSGIGRIGSCAFANCKELNSVEFQDVFLWEIGWGAFLNCRNLFNFSIPVNVKKIETIAFANCSSLRSVRVPGLCRVEDQAFLSCTNLTLVEVGKNALIGKAAFATEVVEDGVTSHKPYNGEIIGLPATINTDNCLEYGLAKEAVAICIKKAAPLQTDTRQSDVDTNIPGSLVMRNDTYALIIGNENYRFVANVPFANNDASVFSEYCKNTLGIPASNIHLCQDATKHMILEQELNDWLKEEIQDKAGKKLIVYYAGHGVPDIQDHNKSYLLPTDVYGTKPQRGISLDAFYSELGRLGFARVTLFIDACFSGVNRDNEGLNTERAVEVEAEDAKPTIGNLIVFSAAHGNETAQGYQEEGHGLFTYYLLKELQETQGMVTYGKLTDDIRKHVSNVAPTLDLRKKQTPKSATTYSTDAWKNLEF